MSVGSRTVRSLIERTHHSLLRKKRLNTILSAVLIFTVWLPVAVLAEQQFFLPPVVKIPLWILISGIMAGLVVAGYRSFQDTGLTNFYRDFARSSGLPELSYALDLEHSRDANPALVEAAILSNLATLDENALEKALKAHQEGTRESRRFRQLSILLFFTTLLSVVTISLSPGAFVRFAGSWNFYEKPNPYTFTIAPGDTTIEQGSTFSAQANFTGDHPEAPLLYLKTDVEQAFRSRAMEEENGRYFSIPVELNNDIEYYIGMGRYKSPVYRVRVQLRPRFTDLTALVIPPAYTGLDSTLRAYPLNRIRAYQGSEIRLRGRSNKPLSGAFVTGASDTTTLISADSIAFDHTFSVSEPDTIEFLLTDTDGLTNKNSFRFEVDPLKDGYPLAELIEPAVSYDEVDPDSVRIIYRASDDFGLTRAELRYSLKRAFVTTPAEGRIRLATPENNSTKAYSWELEQLQLKPKDELTFFIEITDNDRYSGPKSSRSQEITLTVPSLADYFDELDTKENEVQDELESVSESFREMERQYEQFKEQLQDNPSTDYQQQRQLQEVQRQQEEIQKRIEELNEKFEDIKTELSEKNLLSEETLEAYNELKKLMEEIDDPNFREALEKLQEQMGQMSPEQLRKALEETEFNEELYKERLERTVELFKKLKLNADLEKLAQTYEDLARQEQQAEESTDSTQQQKERESILEQTEQLKERLEKLEENTTDKTEKAVKELKELSEKELDDIRKKLGEKLKKNEGGDQKSGDQKENDSGEKDEQNNDDQSGEQQESSPQPNSIQQQFKQLSKKTRSAMQMMNQQQLNINIAGLQYVLYSLITLSDEQEDLVSVAGITENRSQAYVEFARDQKNVEGIFDTISDSLIALSREIPQFSNQITEKTLETSQRLSNSLLQMAERNQARASVASRQSLGGINEIAFLIANLLEQLQGQSGSGGSGSQSMQQMMEQLQQMGQDQQQINQQIQDMINDMQGERLSQDQMERLDQLSKQQNRIRKQMEELQRSGALEGGDELGSKLERMIEDMEETINDLRGGAVDPTLIERQQNILSRMLEAEQALQERDEEEKREGTTADPLQQQTPPDMSIEELEQQIRKRLNDPNFTPFAPDYQRLIERYFELLQRRSL